MSDTAKIEAVQWRGNNFEVVTRFAPGLVWMEGGTLWARLVELVENPCPIPVGWILYRHYSSELLTCSEKTWADWYSPNRAARRREVGAHHAGH